MDRVFIENRHSRLQNIASKSARPASGVSAVPALNGASQELWALALVLLLTAVLFFFRLGVRALWASEFRWAEIAREMLLTRNYFWPTINGKLYFDKPLGSYWLVLAASWITGKLDESASRIPSAVSGLLAVLLLILLARRLYDLRTGIVAGLILTTSFSFAFWARTASADVETVTGELAALLIFATCRKRVGWWVVPMWLVMALTSLMKGLLGFVLPILVIGINSCLADGWLEFRSKLSHGTAASRLYWLIERNRWFFNWRTLVAVMLAGGVYLAPFAISYVLTGSARGMYMVYRENVERYFAPFDHRGAVYLYFLVIFGLMAPWSAFLPAALVNAHGRAQTAEASTIVPQSDRFALAFFWTIFLFFTLSGSRRSYYLLPILPAAAILVARIFVIDERSLSRATRTLAKFGHVVIVLVLISSVLVFLPARVFLPTPYSLWPPLPHAGIFLVCWIISLGMGAYAQLGDNRARILLSVGASSYLFLSYLFFFAIPAGDQWRGERRFAEAARQLIGTNVHELASFKTPPPAFYLELSEPVPEYDTPEGLGSAIRNGQVRWIILRRRDVSSLKLRMSEIAAESSYPWDSEEHRGSALVLMKVLP